MTCKDKQENNGVCPHHNLQCGWPNCNEQEQWFVGCIPSHLVDKAKQIADGPIAYPNAERAQQAIMLIKILLKSALPQRKPLTDGEMDAVIDGCPKYHGRYSTKDPNGKLNYYELIRAIEAAHGIKE